MLNSSQAPLSPEPLSTKARPMVMFTGFLGAGKTTFLRHLLIELNALNILADVILNDRENAYIDKYTLEDHAAKVKALTGSCVCCEGFGALIDMVADASVTPHEVLLLELNGTADPVPLQESFTLLESRFSLWPRWQVCIIDPRNFGQRDRFNDLENLQLETASHYYLTRNEELSSEEECRIKEQIRTINPLATSTTPLDLARHIAQSIKINALGTVVGPSVKKAGYIPVDFAPTRQDSRHQLAHEFTGCQVSIPIPLKQFQVLEWLDQLPVSVIRAKALVHLETDPHRLYLYERVGLVTSTEPVTVAIQTVRPCSGIFIGADINPRHILELTQKYLHTTCILLK